MSNTVEITADAPGFPVVVHRDHSHFGGGSFVGGIMVGVVGLLMIQRRRRRLDDAAPPPAGTGRYDDVEALRRRTATLERIVTEPAARLEREIDALR